MANPFRLGLLTHVDGASEPRRIYREAIELLVAAEELGFESGWVAQHHFDKAGRLPSPFPFLSAVAERTSRIRLGTAIVVLPFEHPLRLAEDAAVVDALSGGRLELGVGSGGDPAEFQAFGSDMSRRRELTTEVLHALQRTLAGEPVGDTELRLHPPAALLGERLWQAAYGVPGAQHAARNGAGLLINRAVYEAEGPSDAIQAGWVRAYREAWGERASLPRVGLSRGVYLAEDRRAALAELREGVSRMAAGFVRQGAFPAGQPLETYCERLYVSYGAPEEVAERLAADQALPYTTDLILQFSPATPPLDHAVRMLEQIVGVVAPALGWRPTVS